MSAGNPCWLAKDINAGRAKIRPNKTDAGSITVGLSEQTCKSELLSCWFGTANVKGGLQSLKKFKNKKIYE